MGLYINHLETISIEFARTLYLYLLDYGWPDGEWEKIFKRHFMKMGDLADAEGAAVLASPRGIHFANEVLSWHRVGDLNAGEVLPGLLITKTDPFSLMKLEGGRRGRGSIDDNHLELLVIPLRSLCTDEDAFVKVIESIFSDLRRGAELRNFEVAKHDYRSVAETSTSGGNVFRRAGGALELKPNFMGLGVDLKKLFSKS